MATFRTRAASLLRTSFLAPVESHEDDLHQEKQSSPPLSSNLESTLNEKTPFDDQTSNPDRQLSLSSAEKTLNNSNDPAVVHDIDGQTLVRTIPTWVHSLNEDDEDDEELNISSNLLFHIPPSAQIAHHNHSPSTILKHKSEPPRGRLFDLQREWTPPTPRAPVSENASQWRAFANSSAYPVVSADSREIVTDEWLVQNGADYSQPWLAGSENADAENDAALLFRFRTTRKSVITRLQRTVLRSHIIPLAIRAVVWIFSLIALALGCSIHKLANRYQGQPKNPALSDKINGPSPNMAIIVDAIALIYIIYITYDEYTGKPLGLRSARSKMRLVFLDLFFIVFDSANLSLAFEAVTNSRYQCNSASLWHNICHQQKALASVLFIALIAWLLTFSISVFRLVERVSGK